MQLRVEVFLKPSHKAKRIRQYTNDRSPNR